MTAADMPAPAALAPVSTEMQAAFQCYLDGRATGLRITHCEQVTGGFETFIYSVRLAGETPPGAPTPHLPLHVPLILRVYPGVNVGERSEWEAAVIARVRGQGLPAPEVFLFEPDPAPLGGPFLVIEFLQGQRLDQAALGAGLIAVLKLLRNYARAQVAVYELDWPEGRAQQVARPAGAFDAFTWSAHRLAAARAELEQRGIHALLPVVDWLEANRRVLDGEPDVFIHGDFHPLNVFVQGTRVSGVIDWGASGFANRHEDMGWSSMLIATASAVDRKEDRRLAPFRTVAHKLYLGFLWEACRADRKRLRYGEVYAALRWMLIFLPSYLPNAGPAILNPDAVAFTTPLYVRRVRRFIEKRTKLKLAIA